MWQRADALFCSLLACHMAYTLHVVQLSAFVPAAHANGVDAHARENVDSLAGAVIKTVHTPH